MYSGTSTLLLMFTHQLQHFTLIAVSRIPLPDLYNNIEQQEQIVSLTTAISSFIKIHFALMKCAQTGCI